MSDQSKGNADVLSETKAEEAKDDGVITCDACPVLCRIRPEKTGACSRYGNVNGKLTRTDPVIVTQQISDEHGDLVTQETHADTRTTPEQKALLNDVLAGIVGTMATDPALRLKLVTYIVNVFNHPVEATEMKRLMKESRDYLRE